MTFRKNIINLACERFKVSHRVKAGLEGLIEHLMNAITNTTGFVHDAVKNLHLSTDRSIRDMTVEILPPVALAELGMLIKYDGVNHFEFYSFSSDLHENLAERRRKSVIQRIGNEYMISVLAGAGTQELAKALQKGKEPSNHRRVVVVEKY